MKTMTSARRRGKASFFAVMGVSGLLVLLASPLSGPSTAAVSERIVTDLHTGLAISGYDPVAYFTDAAPIVGRAEFEYRFKGVIWRFDNEGNLFGGYDPIAVARGVALAGNPAYWVIARDRLYLFYNPVALENFRADIDNAVSAAEAKWPQVMEGLTP